MAEAMYRQIAEDMRAQIESGELRPGQQLRTEIELREHYGASRNTVRDAIKWLTSLGLVETKPGQGTFVVQKIAPYITNLTANPKAPTLYGEVDRSDPGGNAEKRLLSSTAPQVEIQKASLSIADQLQVAEGSQVVSLWLAGIKSATSTKLRGRCRHPSTRWLSCSRAPANSSKPRISKSAP